MSDDRPHDGTGGEVAGRDALLDALRKATGPARVLAGEGPTAPYSTDRSGLFTGRARAVVRPGGASELAAAISCLHAARAPWVPQGANSGTVGGATPCGGEVVVSTRDLAGVDELDVRAGEVRVRAGTPVGHVRDLARAVGLELAFDEPGRDGATVGGLVATDAAGGGSLRFGRAAAQLIAADVVLPDGTLVRDVAGPAAGGSSGDRGARGVLARLGGLLAGSEGTLGVLTTVRLRLVAERPERATALVAVARVADAVALGSRAVRELAGLEALELVESGVAELVAERSGSHPPLAGTALVLVECAADRSARRALEQFCSRGGEVRAVMVASSENERDELWSWRREAPGALAAACPGAVLDVGVAAGRLPGLLEAAREALGGLAPGAQLVAYGPMGVGAVRLHVFGPGVTYSGALDAIAAAVGCVGGELAGEEGIGRAKARHAGHGAGAAAAEAAKRVLDPFGLANPGVVASPAGPSLARW